MSQPPETRTPRLSRSSGPVLRWRSAVHKALSYLRIGVASPFIVVGAFLTLCGYAVTFVAELISGIDL